MKLAPLCDVLSFGFLRGVALLAATPWIAFAATADSHLFTFDNNSGKNQSISVAAPGWQVFGGAKAVEWTHNAGIVHVKSEAGTNDKTPGYVMFSMAKLAEGASTDRFALLTTGLSIPANNAKISWDAGCYVNFTRNQLLVQLNNGQWLVSARVFTPLNHAGNWDHPNRATYHNELIFSRARSAWAEFSLQPANSMVIGDAPASDLPGDAVITGVGIYISNTSERNGTGVLFDSMEIIPGKTP